MLYKEIYTAIPMPHKYSVKPRKSGPFSAHPWNPKGTSVSPLYMSHHHEACSFWQATAALPGNRDGFPRVKSGHPEGQVLCPEGESATLPAH